MSGIRRRTPLIFCLVGVLLLAACGGESTEEFDPVSLIGTPAADLQGVDLTGAGVTDLATLAGKPTAVVFWLNTCPHCQDGLPAIQDAWTELASDNNILTVGINNLDAKGPAGYEDTSAFVASTGLTLPTIQHTWEEAQANWQVGGVPTIFILNGEQIIEDVLIGSEDLVSRMKTSLENVECCGSG